MANNDKKTGSYFQPFREITVPFETRSKASSSEIVTSIIGQINNEFRKIYNRLFSRRVDADLIKGSDGLKPMKFEGASEYTFDGPVNIEDSDGNTRNVMDEIDARVKKSGDTMTGPLRVSKYVTVNRDTTAGYYILKADDETYRNYILSRDADNALGFRQYNADGTHYDVFYLPFGSDTTTTDTPYSILTSKKTVTIAQGGHGGTDAFTGTNNLMALFLGNVAGVADLASGTDLNTVGVGVYRSASSALSASLVNGPPVTSAGFRLIVSNLTTGNSLIQTAIYNNTTLTIYVRIRNSNNAWGDWKKITFS